VGPRGAPGLLRRSRSGTLQHRSGRVAGTKPAPESHPQGTTRIPGIHGRMLTPAFASPEQIRGEILTTAADVYALGVLLYFILTGHRPYDMGGLSTAEVERTICEVTPPLPSEAAAAGSPERGRRLRGDLDTMIMTALQKEPIRRYASVRALAEDIERHLEGHPVLARPDTPGYRARRFIARNRGLVAAAAVIVGLFGGFTSLAAYTAVTSRAQNRVIAMERDRAQLESEKAEAVADHRAIDASDDQIAQVEGLLDSALTALGRPTEAAPLGDR